MWFSVAWIEGKNPVRCASNSSCVNAAQAAVPVLPGDTEAVLAARVLAQEHVAYPLALRLFAVGGDGTPPPMRASLLNPLPAVASLQ